VVYLQQGEMNWLANHMGHDVEIHVTVYKVHDSSIELAKVSPVAVLRWGQGGGTGPRNLAHPPFCQGNLGLTCLHQFILYCTI